MASAPLATLRVARLVSGQRSRNLAGPTEEGYRLSESQVQAILDLRLHRLTGLEQDSLRQELDDLRAGYKKLFSGKDNLQDRVADLLSDKIQTQALKEVIDFIQQDSSRAICQPKDD